MALLSERAHTVVVGGTGMLRGVCLWLAARGDAVSVVARRSDRLDALAREAHEVAGVPGSIHGISLDYGDDRALREGLTAAVDERGPVALAVCWIHATAPRALRVVAETLTDKRSEKGALRLLQLKGSIATDPSRPRPEIEGSVASLSGVRWEVVLLGFVREGDRSRWLTDREIADGVIEAIRSPLRVHEVGALRPWSERP